MYCKIQSLSSIKPTKKDTLRSLSELLGQKVVASPQKIIQQKMFSTNLPRNLLTQQLDAKFQNRSKDMHKNRPKINFQFERMTSSFKQHRSQFFFKRSQTLNPKSSTQKLRNTIKNQFQILNSHPISTKNSQNQRNLKDYGNLQSKISSQKKMNLKDSQILIAKKYPEKFYKSSSVDLSKNIGIPSHLNPEIKQIHTNKKSFLKKGTSLQKQIVINLLKNKIIKQHEFETKKQYTTREVLSMIKLYKGFHKDQAKNKYENVLISKRNKNQSSQKDQFCPLDVVNKLKRPIQGWQIKQQIEIQ